MVQVRLMLAALTAGCLETPPSSRADDPAVDAAPIDCVCPADPCPFAWARPLTIDASLILDETLEQVPILVRVETSARMADDGSDLRFATPDGAMLAHEIDRFPPDSGTAELWVALPSIPASGSAGFCMFYGGEPPDGGLPAVDVWDSSFAAVWHLDEQASGAAGEFADSSAHGCAGQGGSPDLGPPAPATGVVSLGQQFAGDDVISFGDGAHLDLTGEGITLEAWVNLPARGAQYMGVVSKDGFVGGYRLLVGTLGEVALQLTWDQRRVETSPGVVVPGAWHHLAGTYDGSRLVIYVDGVLAASVAGSGAIDSSASRLYVGSGAGVYPLIGVLDEVRISTVARSRGWIAVQRAAMNGELVAVGEEQPP